MEYPRVTEILRPFSNVDHIPSNILNKAAARGTRVHNICNELAKGAWIPDSFIDEECKPYVDSFKLWRDAQVDTFEILEKRFIHNHYLYTGQIDAVITCNEGKLHLVDYKTTASPSKTHSVQLSAYNALLLHAGVKVETAWIVYLQKDGDFPDITILENPAMYMDVFEGALRCYYYFNNGK